STQLDRLSTVSADGLHRLQQIAGIAGARAAAVVVVTLVEVIYGPWARIHSQLLDHGVEDARVHLPFRRQNTHLVTDTSQEGVVHQILRVEVGGEDGQLLERHFKLLPGGEGQEVVSIFEG